MKKFFSTNGALVELLNEQIEMTCNADMEIIVSDEDAERIAEIVATLAPAAISDYMIEEISEEISDLFRELKNEYYDVYIKALDNIEDELKKEYEEEYEENKPRPDLDRDWENNRDEYVRDRLQLAATNSEVYEMAQKIVDEQYPELSGALTMWIGDGVEIADERAVCAYLTNLKK